MTPPLATSSSRPHRSYGFAATRDPDFLRQAARAVRDGATTLVLPLAPGAVGHAFPTGDLFRRLELVPDDERDVVEASILVAAGSLEP